MNVPFHFTLMEDTDTMTKDPDRLYKCYKCSHESYACGLSCTICYGCMIFKMTCIVIEIAIYSEINFSVALSVKNTAIGATMI